MKISKVFNNNIVAAITPDKKEAIVTGNGIAFGAKVGDRIDERKISKCYFMKNAKKDRLYQVLESTPVLYLEIAEAIVDKAKQALNKDVNDAVLAGLCDHIYFAIDRQKKGTFLPNLIQQEMKLLYPKEFDIGTWSLRYIYTKTGVKLPDDEAGYIAIHILNAVSETDADVGQILVFIKDMSDVVEETFALTLQKESFAYYRMMAHLRFFYQRMTSSKKQDLSDIQDMYDLLLHKHQRMPKFIKNINFLLQDEYDYTCSTSEHVYLMMHILRILQQS